LIICCILTSSIVYDHNISVNCSEGIEDVAYVPLAELAAIDGFDDDIAQELRNRAREHLLSDALETEERKAELEIDPRLLQLNGLDDEVAFVLAEKGVINLDDLADLATDELLEMSGEALSQEVAESMIMEARQLAGWFDEEDQE
ncbi:MAG: hypothetical protein HQL69_07890, partial [Magnetococcales bacterium]|nr:hypothetical protein [Magnetococcales bacterium]